MGAATAGGASEVDVAGIEVLVVAGDVDMIEQGQSDTKVVGARVLPCLGRRL